MVTAHSATAILVKLRIFSLSHSSTFSEGVRVLGWPFPFFSLSVSSERSNSSAI
uniref:Peroxisome biogenesis protein 3-2 isoform X2 n=1 Tax=Rhizophora mucronata TaxID=61149 RepID=A0A2P2K029_RHIMU